MDDAEAVELNGPTKTEKPRGACTGCRFDYQLGTARTGEHKGELVIRKHNSRTGPGLCEGAAKPPRAPETEELECACGGAGADDGCTNCSVDDEHTTGCTEEARFGPAVCHGCPQPDNPDIPFAVAVAPGGIPVFSDPAPVAEGDVSDDTTRGPWVRAGFDSECNGTCGTDISEGDEIRADGEGGWLCEDCGADEPTTLVVHERAHCAPSNCTGCCGCSSMCTDAPCTGARPITIHPMTTALIDTRIMAATEMPRVLAPDQFAAPAPVAAEMPSVSQQPDPDRDRWGRYMIMGKPHTRATTFAKAASSTFSLNQWQQRMTIAGLVIRPDLIALAHGLDVKRDRATLNSIAEQAKEAAGQKVAANLGTAYHAFSERLDAGLIALSDVPTEYRGRLDQYLTAVNGAGLRTRPEWIERTVAVRADQVSAELPVAGTLDRIFQLPNGELVIGDLKTGADLSYGWGEIAVQLALYAHGVNTHGLFDWHTKRWMQHIDVPGGMKELRVRTDFAIVVHLPAGGEGCTLYRVDLNAGWKRAQVCGQVMAMQKAKPEALAVPFTTTQVLASSPLLAPPAPVRGEVAEMNHAWEHAKGVFANAGSQAELAQLYQYAMDSGKFHTDQLATLVGIGKDRLNALA